MNCIYNYSSDKNHMGKHDENTRGMWLDSNILNCGEWIDNTEHIQPQI